MNQFTLSLATLAALMCSVGVWAQSSSPMHRETRSVTQTIVSQEVSTRQKPSVVHCPRHSEMIGGGFRLVATPSHHHRYTHAFSSLSPMVSEPIKHGWRVKSGSAQSFVAFATCQHVSKP